MKTQDTIQRTIKPGYGYWDVTYYPRGGCFCRASRTGSVTTVTIERVSEKYSDGTPKEFVGTIDGGNRRICIDADALNP